MAKTQYQKSPPSALTSPAYNPNPLAAITVTGQGSASKPVPPKPITLGKKILPAPSKTGTPGASGTI